MQSLAALLLTGLMMLLMLGGVVYGLVMLYKECFPRHRRIRTRRRTR